MYKHSSPSQRVRVVLLSKRYPNRTVRHACVDDTLTVNAETRTDRHTDRGEILSFRKE